jgi:hypothetical protein
VATNFPPRGTPGSSNDDSTSPHHECPPRRQHSRGYANRISNGTTRLLYSCRCVPSAPPPKPSAFQFQYSFNSSIHVSYYINSAPPRAITPLLKYKVRKTQEAPHHYRNKLTFSIRHSWGPPTCTLLKPS